LRSPNRHWHQCRKRHQDRTSNSKTFIQTKETHSFSTGNLFSLGRRGGRARPSHPPPTNRHQQHRQFISYLLYFWFTSLFTYVQVRPHNIFVHQ
jgi:hypothetical protein